MLANSSARAVAVPAPAPTRRPSVYRAALRQLLHDPIGLIAAAVLIVVVTSALIGPMVAAYDPSDQNIAARLRPPAWQARGSLAHVLGTDQLGRDLLSRLIYGARISVAIGVTVVLVGAVVGTALGLAGGFFGGRLDSLVVGVTDVMLAFPLLLLALIIAAAFGASIPMMVLALSLRGWVVYARVTRGQTLSLSRYQYIEAARAIGVPSASILSRHLLPNLMPSILTVAVLELARMVLAESSLSFLGLGVQPPGISWGLMLAEGRDYMLTANWLVTFPGLAIAATVLSANILASHVRRVADPFQRGRTDSGSR